MFRVIGTESYNEQISQFSKSEQEAAHKIHHKLAEFPHTGKLLVYPALFEKRIEGKRIYFLKYNDLQLVLMVAASGKKDQQETIDHIKGNLDEFRKEAERIAKPNL